VVQCARKTSCGPIVIWCECFTRLELVQNVKHQSYAALGGRPHNVGTGPRHFFLVHCYKPPNALSWLSTMCHVTSSFGFDIR